MTLRRASAMGGAWQGRRERSYPEDTGATEDAIHAPHSAVGRHKASFREELFKLTYLEVRASDLFAPEEIERARRYHRPLYWALGVDLLLELGVLLAIVFGPPGDWLSAATGGPWWARAIELVALVAGVGAMVRLPLSAWRGWLYERRWGFSTQTLRGWLWDRLKGLVVGVALSGFGLVALVWSIRAWPGWWPAAAAPGAATLALALSLVAPIVFERLFNRFWPLPDAGLALELHELSVRAGVPVRTLLVTDASRRTRKHNAYVSGLGPTRRLVVFDTLLEDASRGELRGVVAHELGHRRYRHVAAGTLLAMAGAAAAVLVLWGLLSWGGLVAAAGAAGPADPRIVPLVLLVSWSLELVALPFETWLSRRWERAADRFALDLTGDGAVIEQMHRRLALANLADLDPPPLLYRLLFTHPTPPERVAAARLSSEAR
jgi:STE24 endopeptidase